MVVTTILASRAHQLGWGLPMLIGAIFVKVGAFRKAIIDD